MSWHTSIVFIQQAPPVDFGELLAELGFPGLSPGQTISFEDATSSSAPGVSVAHVQGWTVLCDPEFFGCGTPAQMPTELWSPRFDQSLGIISTGGVAFGFFTEGASGRHGFTLHRNGVRERLWLRQAGEVLADEGPALAEEPDCFGRGGPFNEEQGLLRLMGKVCVSWESLEAAEFCVFLRIADAATGKADPRTLLDLLGHDDVLIVVDSICRLVHERPPLATAIPRIAELLRSESAEIRGTAACALGEFGPMASDSIPDLLPLLHDRESQWYQDRPKSYPIRFRAAFAIARIQPERSEIVPVLREALNYRKFKYVRDEAFETLIQMGVHASIFIPELKADENHSDPLRRVSVQRTLAALDSDYRITDELTKHVIELAAQLKANL